MPLLHRRGQVRRPRTHQVWKAAAKQAPWGTSDATTWSLVVVFTAVAVVAVVVAVVVVVVIVVVVVLVVLVVE